MGEMAAKTDLDSCCVLYRAVRVAFGISQPVSEYDPGSGTNTGNEQHIRSYQ